MKRTYLSLVLAAMMVFGVSRVACALLVTHKYCGLVDFIEMSDPPFDLGQTFTLSYTFDSTTPATGDAYYNVIGKLTAQVGSYSAIFNQFIIRPNYSPDPTDYAAYYVSAHVKDLEYADYITPPSKPYLSLYSIGLILRDNVPSSAITSFDLPVDPYDPSNLSGDNLLYISFAFRDIGVLAYNEAHSVKLCEAPVPEPTTMLLLGTGLVGLAVIGRKRFKK